ncbi:MAG: hypothetical protein R2810_09270 [Flavobacteriales bacterium]
MHIYEADTLAWSMNVVVAPPPPARWSSATSSPPSCSTLLNIPRSIIRNEILPAVKRTSSYLAQKNMEVVRGARWFCEHHRLEPVHRQRPSSIRQPGTSNSLGLVKFLFPTSSASISTIRRARACSGGKASAFSHGCIRLG